MSLLDIFSAKMCVLLKTRYYMQMWCLNLIKLFSASIRVIVIDFLCANIWLASCERGFFRFLLNHNFVYTFMLAIYYLRLKQISYHCCPLSNKQKCLFNEVNYHSSPSCLALKIFPGHNVLTYLHVPFIKFYEKFFPCQFLVH